MSSVLEKSPAAHIAPPEFVDPLSLDLQMSRVDKAVNDLLDASVSNIEDEITRIMRRREIASSVRHVHFLRRELSHVGASGMSPDLQNVHIDGLKAEMIAEFIKINPGADPAMIENSVEKTVARFRAEPESEPDEKVSKKKGK